MIHINLLPPSMRRSRAKEQAASRAPQGNKILFFGLVGSVIFLVFLYVLFVVIPIGWASYRLSSWQKQWTSFEKEIGEVEALDKQQRDAAARLAEIQNKTQGRVRWAKILNAVSDTVPPSIRLKRATAATLSEVVVVPAAAVKIPAPKGQTAPAKTKRVYRVFELEGIAERGSLGEEDLRRFMEDFRSHPAFKEYFERMELVGVSAMPDQGKRFSLRCRLKEKNS